MVNNISTGVHMSKVSITQAAKLAGISRSYLYRKYINTGKLSVLTEDDKKLIDVSELIRVFGELQVDKEQITEYAQSDTQQINTSSQDRDRLIAHLERELAEVKADAKQREEWLKSQLEKATHLLEDKTVKSRKKFLGIF